MLSTDVKTKKPKYRRNIFICILSVVLIGASLLVTFGGTLGVPGWNDIFAFFGVYADLGDGISLSFLNVGTADACYIKCKDKNVLIDTGTSLAYDKISAYLKRSSCTHFDAVIISHSDGDHIGSAADIIRDFGVDTLYMYSDGGKGVGESREYDSLVNSIKEYNVNVVSPDIPSGVEIGDMTFEFISPLKKYKKTNENSLAVRICYEDKSFLFTGDMTKKAERDLLNSDTELNSDVLKVAHHGSSTSSSTEFLKAVSPEIAVISVGANERYLPDYYTLTRIYGMSKELYRTDRDKTVVVTYDGNELRVHTNA